MHFYISSTNSGVIISVSKGRERNFPIEIVAIQGTSSLQGQQHLPYLLQINVVLVSDRRVSVMTSDCRAWQLQLSLILCLRDTTYNYLASTVFTNEEIIRWKYNFLPLWRRPSREQLYHLIILLYCVLKAAIPHSMRGACGTVDDKIYLRRV